MDVACSTEETRNACKILDMKPSEKGSIGRARRKVENDIKMDLELLC
jgi:hypothetical protein